VALESRDDGTRWVTSGGSTVGVRPDRGAIVTHIKVDGVELLYLDESTLDSPTGAVRGGVPLLFPFAGELRDGRLLATGTELGRHGFARRKAWQVIDETADTITMRLAADDDTRPRYPFAFDAKVVVRALPRGASIRLEVDNPGSAPMPLAPGWHPYFSCPTRLKRTCLRPVLHDIELPVPEPFECDVNIAAPPDRRVAFDLPHTGRVTLTSSPNLATLEIWTLPGKDFVCIEPWVGPSNTINTSARVELPPGGRVEFWMTIEQH
jgi:galactose mutarotase-like enzyme